MPLLAGATTPLSCLRHEIAACVCLLAFFAFLLLLCIFCSYFFARSAKIKTKVLLHSPTPGHYAYIISFHFYCVVRALRQFSGGVHATNDFSCNSADAAALVVINHATAALIPPTAANTLVFFRLGGDASVVCRRHLTSTRVAVAGGWAAVVASHNSFSATRPVSGVGRYACVRKCRIKVAAGGFGAKSEALRQAVRWKDTGVWLGVASYGGALMEGVCGVAISRVKVDRASRCEMLRNWWSMRHCTGDDGNGNNNNSNKRQQAAVKVTTKVYISRLMTRQPDSDR